jgi:hypothetical protein
MPTHGEMCDNVFRVNFIGGFDGCTYDHAIVREATSCGDTEGLRHQSDSRMSRIESC